MDTLFQLEFERQCQPPQKYCATRVCIAEIFEIVALIFGLRKPGISV